MSDEAAPVLPVPTPWGKRVHAPEKDDFGVLAEMLCGLFTDPSITLDDHCDLMMDQAAPPEVFAILRRVWAGQRRIDARQLRRLAPWCYQAWDWTAAFAEGDRRLEIGAVDEVLFHIRASHPDLLEAVLLWLDAKPEDVMDL